VLRLVSTLNLDTSTTESTYNTNLENLSDGSKYYYKINTFDTEGDEYEGNTLTFENVTKTKNKQYIYPTSKGYSTTDQSLITWNSNTELVLLQLIIRAILPLLQRIKLKHSY